MAKRHPLTGTFAAPVEGGRSPDEGPRRESVGVFPVCFRGPARSNQGVSEAFPEGSALV